MVGLRGIRAKSSELGDAERLLCEISPRGDLSEVDADRASCVAVLLSSADFLLLAGALRSKVAKLANLIKNGALLKTVRTISQRLASIASYEKHVGMVLRDLALGEASEAGLGFQRRACRSLNEGMPTVYRQSLDGGASDDGKELNSRLPSGELEKTPDTHARIAATLMEVSLMMRPDVERG